MTERAGALDLLRGALVPAACIMLTGYFAYHALAGRSGVFALGYGCARFFTEYFRTPDYEVSFAGITISAGQMLSLPMIALGIVLLVVAYRRAPR